MGVGESRLPPRETGGHSEKPVTDLSGGEGVRRGTSRQQGPHVKS